MKRPPVQAIDEGAPADPTLGREWYMEAAMKAIAEIQVIPIGAGVSVRKEVKRAHELLEQAGLTVQLHAYGTNVEGDMAQIFDAVRRVHETLHAEGTVRLTTAIKIGTRSDKEVSLSGKLF